MKQDFPWEWSRIGIDMGGTNTQLGLVDNWGVIHSRASLPTAGTLEEYVVAVARAVKQLCEDSRAEGIDVTGIGIGAPAANSRTGCIEGATDIPWRGNIPLKELLEKATGLPVDVANDANCAAAGEHAYGTARHSNNFICITLGTGVGAGIFCDGHLLMGRNGFAGELGHVIIDPRGEMCGCGRRGCLQTFASSKGVANIARRLLVDTSQYSLLRKKDPAEIDAKAVFGCAEMRDAIAVETYRRMGEALGKACAMFAAVTDPDMIVFFGGVTRASRHFLPYVKEAFRQNALFLNRDRVEFRLSGLPDSDAAILGASAVALGNTAAEMAEENKAEENKKD